MIVSTGVIQEPQAFNTPMMEEVFVVMTAYNTGTIRTPQRVIRTDVDCSAPDSSDSGNSDVCHSLNPPSVCICNNRVGNIGQTPTPKFRESSELHASVDKIFSNDSNVMSVDS